MKTFVVLGSGRSVLKCGMDLDVIVTGAEDVFLEGAELVFKDKDGKEVCRFDKWTGYYCSGVWDD